MAKTVEQQTPEECCVRITRIKQDLFPRGLNPRDLHSQHRLKLLQQLDKLELSTVYPEVIFNGTSVPSSDQQLLEEIRRYATMAPRLTKHPDRRFHP